LRDNGLRGRFGRRGGRHGNDFGRRAGGGRLTPVLRLAELIERAMEGAPGGFHLAREAIEGGAVFIEGLAEAGGEAGIGEVVERVVAERGFAAAEALEVPMVAAEDIDEGAFARGLRLPAHEVFGVKRGADGGLTRPAAACCRVLALGQVPATKLHR
jgi:hypothetical protein